MSTDWGIGCRTCRDALPDVHPTDKRIFSGDWDNCRDVEALEKLCANTALVVAAKDAFGETVSFQEYTGSSVVFYGLAGFFKAHAGHDLAAMSEYGEFHDQCRNRVKYLTA